MKTLEKWHDITEYRGYKFNGKYEVSNWGNVRNKETKQPISTFESRKNHGYLKTRITDVNQVRRTMYIHQLVAFFFVEGFDQNKEVNHKDGNIRNNSFSNLEWVSHTENMKHFYSNCKEA